MCELLQSSSNNRTSRRLFPQTEIYLNPIAHNLILELWSERNKVFLPSEYNVNVLIYIKSFMFEIPKHFIG